MCQGGSGRCCQSNVKRSPPAALQIPRPGPALCFNPLSNLQYVQCPAPPRPPKHNATFQRPRVCGVECCVRCCSVRFHGRTFARPALAILTTPLKPIKLERQKLILHRLSHPGNVRWTRSVFFPLRLCNRHRIALARFPFNYEHTISAVLHTLGRTPAQLIVVTDLGWETLIHPLRGQSQTPTTASSEDDASMGSIASWAFLMQRRPSGSNFLLRRTLGQASVRPIYKDRALRTESRRFRASMF